MDIGLLVARSGLEKARDGICLLDCEGYVTFANRAARRIWRCDDPHSLRGRLFRDMWQHPQKIDELVMDAVERNGGVTRDTSIAQDGSTIELLIGATSLAIEESQQASAMVSLWVPPEEPQHPTRGEVTKTEQRLRKELAEKDFLLKELNHRAVNNLAMIAALVELKQGNSDEATNLLEIQQHIAAVRIVHEKLYEANENVDVELSDYVREILKQLFSTFSTAPVTLQDDMHAIAVPAKPAALLGLIVNEVATNAIKHGFTSESERRFTVTLHQDPRSGTVRLTMENTGNPVPNGIELGNATTAGLRLIEALVDQLDGKIELEKCPQARFTIWFPVSAGQSSR